VFGIVNATDTLNFLPIELVSLVALNIKDYTDHMVTILSDKTTYDVIKKDSLKKITNELVFMLTLWTRKRLLQRLYE